MVGSSLAPKWPILVPFSGMNHQKCNFSLILAPFLLEAVEASRCYFFENWLVKLKCPNLRNIQITSFWLKSCFKLASEVFKVCQIQSEDPVENPLYQDWTNFWYKNPNCPKFKINTQINPLQIYPLRTFYIHINKSELILNSAGKNFTT